MFFFNITIKEVKDTIGEWCKLKRQAHNMSQEELAIILDMSRLTIQKVETGKNANVDTVLKIINHFGGLETLYRHIKQDIDNNNRESLY